METISKKELVRDIEGLRCDISTLQRNADNITRRIDQLPNDPPKHEWKDDEWYWCGHLSQARQYKNNLNQVMTDLDVPIQTPHEIGTWIADSNGRAFKISERRWDVATPPCWIYVSGDEIFDEMLARDATVIPAPKFEVGERIGHIGIPEASGKIEARHYSPEISSWSYQTSGSVSEFIPELYFTRVPEHKWRMGNWAYHKAAKCIFIIDKIENGYLYDVSNQLYYPANCVPVHFIQIEGDPIRKGSIVRTPQGWIGSVIADSEEDPKWFVDGHGQGTPRGWYAATELTLCSPEVTK